MIVERYDPQPIQKGLSSIFNLGGCGRHVGQLDFYVDLYIYIYIVIGLDRIFAQLKLDCVDCGPV